MASCHHGEEASCRHCDHGDGYRGEEACCRQGDRGDRGGGACAMVETCPTSCELLLRSFELQVWSSELQPLRSSQLQVRFAGALGLLLVR
jgi:hypothetical protein